MSHAQTPIAVVVPIAAGDRISPRLYSQLLSGLPDEVRLHLVCAQSDDIDRQADGLPSSSRAHWLSAPPGRASQQNAGAHAAPENVYLWFVHADSQLHDTTLPALLRFVRSGTQALGYFDLRFLNDGPALTRINAAGAWVRSRALHMPFGDQGLVLPSAAFTKLGGFNPELPCGEDHDLVWRARQSGLALRALRAPLYTSARKYARLGWLRTTCQHLLITARQARRFSKAGQRA